MLFEDASEFGGGAGAVVGEGVDQDGDAAGGVAFVDRGFVVFAAEFAGAFHDRFFDRVLGHVGGFGFVDDVAKGEVVAGVAAIFGGDNDLAGDLAPDLTALG